MKEEVQIISEVVRVRGDIRRLKSHSHKKKRPFLRDVITLLQQVEKQMWQAKFVEVGD